MSRERARYRVGELRPSQVLLSFGIGSVVDLPGLSVMIMGLDDWDVAYATEINEPRLLATVQGHVGSQVTRLLAPPRVPDTGAAPGPFDESALVGVPVASFPRWVVCPSCRLLGPLASGLFALKANPYRPDRTRYVHQNCSNLGRPPAVNPARFLVACERGHLDDFPWLWFVHRGADPCPGPLRFSELGASGEAADVLVVCDGCQRRRRMVEAFGEEGQKSLPPCRGRRPHLRDWEEGCPEPARAILLGASNSWFPVVLSALAAGPRGVPVESRPGRAASRSSRADRLHPDRVSRRLRRGGLHGPGPARAPRPPAADVAPRQRGARGVDARKRPELSRWSSRSGPDRRWRLFPLGAPTRRCSRSSSPPSRT